MGTMRFRPPSSVCDLALSPDEKTVVTIGECLIAWSTTTGEELWRARDREFGFLHSGPRYGSHPIAFSSDSSKFYTAGDNNQFVVWDISSGQRSLVSIQTPANADKRGFVNRIIQSVDVTSDGEVIAAGCSAGLDVCDPQGKVRFSIPNVHEKDISPDNRDRLNMQGNYCMGRFSPDGKLLAVVASDRPEEIRLHDVTTGKELHSVKLSAKLIRLAFSPDGEQIVATERDNAIRLYDVKSSRQVWSKVLQLNNPFENYTSAIAFSPDAKTIAVCATDNRIRLLDPVTGEAQGELIGHHWYPWALAFTSNNQMLYSAGWDAVIRRWDVPSRKQLELPQGVHGTGIVAASPDGRTLAYQDDSGNVRIVNADDGVERQKLALAETHFSQLLFSPDGSHLAAGGSSGEQVQVVVWDISSGKQVQLWNWPKGRDPHSTVESLCFTFDSTRLAAAMFRQSTAFVWDLSSGEQIAKLNHNQIHSLSFSPDGSSLATGGWDSTVRFWEADKWSMRREFEVPDRRVLGKIEPAIDVRVVSVCYAPEGGLIATSHLNGLVKIYQSDDLALRSKLKVEGNISQGNIAFSPDGLWLATGSRGGEVELWDPLSGKKVWLAGNHQSDAVTLGFGRDNQTLVSGGEDHISYLWDLRPPVPSSEKDPSQLWSQLAGDDAAAAYKAMWTLSDDPDRTVALMAEKLRPVRTVYDLDRIDSSQSPDEIKSRRRMKKILVDKDPTIESEIAVRRAMSVLQQLATPGAIRLLKEFADRGPIARYATTALNRANVTENP